MSDPAVDFTKMTPEQISAYVQSQNGGASASGSGTKGLIGVPDGFVAMPSFQREKTSRGYGYSPGQGPGSDVRPTPALYKDGDQYALGSLDPVALSQLQQQMRNAGLLKDGYRAGYGGDPATIAAYTQLLAEANQTGFTADQTLRRRLANPQVDAAKTTGPFTAKAYLKPDAASLKEGVRGLMKQVLGPDREPTDAELEDLTSRLGSLDREAFDASTAADQANYNADAAGSAGGATVANVDPSAQLTDYLRTAYKPEIDMTKGTTDLTANRDGLMGSIFAIDKAIASPGL